MNIPSLNFEFPTIKAPDLNPKIFDRYENINRLIIVGNGFDLAHGLKSSFKDFIYDYSLKTIKRVLLELRHDDVLISINANAQFTDAENYLDKLSPNDAFFKLLSLSDNRHIKLTWKSQFFKSIIRDVENKKWVDIEIQYFDQLKDKNLLKNSQAVKDLNEVFTYIKSCFISYLKEQIGANTFTADLNLIAQFEQPIRIPEARPNTIEEEKKPDNTCILNFNYTGIAALYREKVKSTIYNYIPIHGQLQADEISLQEPVFGFGDEMDEEYIKFELLRNDEIFKHIKSFKYLEYSHYRNLIEFIEFQPYQVQIFGHSCGLSDRTLLNTIFEHENCISIKPFYFENDGINDYEQKIYSIARHFKSKSELRVKVVNKEFCEAMAQPVK
jgi:hypothetical protein